MIIGLTGLTGAGKSAAASVLRRLGCHVIDADKVGHEVTSRPDILEKIKAAFGERFVAPDGTLDRRALGRAVFSDGEKLKKLNALTHPPIAEAIAAEAAAHSGEVVVIDAAALKESGLDRICGEVWCVTAPEGLRLARIMERDGLTRAEAAARIRSQTPYDGACVLIENSSSVEALEKKVKEALCRERGI